jgi:hypothetical protein
MHEMAPCRPGLECLPLPRSARRRAKGEGQRKLGLYTKEAVKEHRLLRELLRKSRLSAPP